MLILMAIISIFGANISIIAGIIVNIEDSTNINANIIGDNGNIMIPSFNPNRFGKKLFQ